MTNEQEHAFEQILHSIQQAQAPGNDWRRELKLIESTCRAALQSKDREDIKEVIERLPRYSVGNISDEWGAGQYLGAVRHDNGRFLRVDEVMVAIYNARRRIEEDGE